MKERHNDGLNVLGMEKPPLTIYSVLVDTQSSILRHYVKLYTSTSPRILFAGFDISQSGVIRHLQ